MLLLVLRNTVLQYVESEISLEQLEDWYVPKLPSLIDDAGSAEANLVAAIELGLAELSSGIVTENELKAYLVEALAEIRIEQHPIIFDQSSERSHWIFGTSNETPLVLVPSFSEKPPVPS